MSWAVGASAGSSSKCQQDSAMRSKSSCRGGVSALSPLASAAGAAAAARGLRGAADAASVVKQTKASKRKATAGQSDRHSSHVVTSVHGTLLYGPDPTNSDLAYVAKLMDATGYSRRELYAMFMQFKALVALSKTSEGIDPETFRKGIPMLSLEDSTFVNRVFLLLDEDKSKIIEWDEFILALTKLEHGTPETRANFLFDVYDDDGEGDIDHDEMLHYFMAAMRLPMEDPGDEAAHKNADDESATSGVDDADDGDDDDDDVVPIVEIGDEYEGIQDSKEYLSKVTARVAAENAKTGVSRLKGLKYFKNICKYFVTRVFEDIDKNHGFSLKRDQIANYLKAHPEVTNVSSMFGRATVELSATSSILEHNKMDLTTLLTAEDAHLPLRWTQQRERDLQAKLRKREEVFHQAQEWRERHRRSQEKRQSVPARAASSDAAAASGASGQSSAVLGSQ